MQTSHRCCELLRFIWYELFHANKYPFILWGMSFLVPVYLLTQLLNGVSKEPCSRGQYTKRRCPGRRKFIDGGLFGALNGAGAWTGPGAGVERKYALSRAIDRGRAGNWGGDRHFGGPRGPVTNTTYERRVSGSIRYFEERCYFLTWTGCLGDEDTWEPLEHLEHAKELVEEFHSEHPDMPKLG